MAKTVRDFFVHGFAIPEEEPKEAEIRIFQNIAKSSGHFAFPFLLFAEGLRPLTFLISSLLIGFQPVGECFVNPAMYQKFSSLFSKRKNWDAFAVLLQKEILRNEDKHDKKSS